MELSIEGKRESLADFARENPRWIDDRGALKARVRVGPDWTSPPPLDLPAHPIFDPWREQVLATAALGADLLMKPGAAPSEPTVSFAHGTTAFLDQTTWPVCGRCETPLDFCFQLLATDLQPWLDQRASLVVMYCFACRSQLLHEGRTHVEAPGAYLKLLEPTYRVERAAYEHPPPRGVLRKSREIFQLSRGRLRWVFPSPMGINFLHTFFLDRHERLDGALLRLFDGVVKITDGDEIKIKQEYGRWVRPERFALPKLIPARVPPFEEWTATETALGGYAQWQQADLSPSCPACSKPMQHLLDYNGHQFPSSGAMRISICDAGACAHSPQLSFTVEF